MDYKNQSYFGNDKLSVDLEALSTMSFNGRMANDAKNAIIKQSDEIQNVQEGLKQLQSANKKLNKLLADYERQMNYFFMDCINEDRIDKFKEIKSERDLVNKKMLKNCIVRLYEKLKQLKTEKKEINSND